MKRINRIACVINRVDSAGGAERVMTVLCNRFVERGIDTTLILRQSTESVYPLDERVNVVATSVACRIPVLRNLLRNLKLRREIRKARPDVVISFLTPINTQTRLYTFGLGVPVIVSERNNPETDIATRDRFMAKWLYPLCQGLVFQTEDAKRWFSNRIQKKSTVIANPISENLPERRDPIPGRIVSVGRLIPQKNQKMLIDSFAAYASENQRATLTIYGQGELREELQRQINEYGLQDRIILAGFSPKVMEDIADAELFVMSSNYEGMPNALLEAMGIGLPCISTDCPCGGPAYLINSGKNGLLIPVGDSKALTEAIRILMQDDEYRDNIGNAAMEIRNRLDSARIADEWLAFCEKQIN